jgi:hypothetical protein
MTEHSEKGKQGRGPNIKVVTEFTGRQFFYCNFYVLFFIYLELFGIVVAVTHTPRRSKKKRTGATSTNIILSILHDFFFPDFF